MKVCLISLGCPKNLIDSEVMAGRIDAAEMEIVYDPEDADVAVVNTCGFIQAAVDESTGCDLEQGEATRSPLDPLAKDHRDGRDERHLDVEDHEDEGDQIEADVEVHPGASGGWFAAFVGLELAGLRVVGT